MKNKVVLLILVISALFLLDVCVTKAYVVYVGIDDTLDFSLIQDFEIDIVGPVEPTMRIKHASDTVNVGGAFVLKGALPDPVEDEELWEVYKAGNGIAGYDKMPDGYAPLRPGIILTLESEEEFSLDNLLLSCFESPNGQYPLPYAISMQGVDFGLMYTYSILPLCSADINEDCTLDLFDLVVIIRYIQGLPVFVPDAWLQTFPSMPDDTDISNKISQCEMTFDIDKNGELNLFDLIFMNRYLQGFPIIVPSIIRIIRPDLPLDVEIAKAVDRLKPACALDSEPTEGIDIIITEKIVDSNLLYIECPKMSSTDTEIIVPVYLDVDEDLFNISFDIYFDPTRLEAAELIFDEGRVYVSPAPNPINNEDGSIHINLVDMSGGTAVAKGDGKMLDVRFNVKGGWESLSTDVGIENIKNVLTTTGVSISLSSQDCTLSIPEETDGLLGMADMTIPSNELEILVPINLDVEEDLFNITFDILFDSQKLEATELIIDENRVHVSPAPNAIDNEKGRIIVNLVDMYGDTAIAAGEGKILDVRFNIKADWDPLSTDLTISSVRNVFSINGNSLILSSENAVITQFHCTLYYKDADGDGYGVEDDALCLYQMDEAENYTAIQVGDCDDTDPERFPGNVEVPDGKDNDCDDVIPPDELNDTETNGAETNEAEANEGGANGAE